MNWVEWIATVSSVLTIVSVALNIVQWERNTQFVMALRAHMQKTFANYFDIARAGCDLRAHLEGKELDRTKISGWANRIITFGDAGRRDVAAYSREHLRMVVSDEHPAVPHELIRSTPGLIARIRRWFRLDAAPPNGS